MTIGNFVPKHNTRLPSNLCATDYHETEPAFPSIARENTNASNIAMPLRVALGTGSTCACSCCAQHRRSCQ